MQMHACAYARACSRLATNYTVCLHTTPLTEHDVIDRVTQLCDTLLYTYLINYDSDVTSTAAAVLVVSKKEHMHAHVGKKKKHQRPWEQNKKIFNVLRKERK